MMLEDQAIVTSIEGRHVHIKSLQNSACAHCMERPSCGTALYAKWLPNRELALVSDLNLNRGDRVIVGIEEHHLLMASVFMYLLPIAIMLLSVGLFEGSDQGSALVATFSLSAGLYLTHYQQHRVTRRFIAAPRIIRKL